MTSSGSGGGDCSPAAPRAVVDNLLDVRKRATMLQTMFEGSVMAPSAVGRELVEGMMSSVTSAMAALNTSCEGGDGGASSYAGRRRNRGAPVAGGPHRRTSSSTSYRRRTMSPFLETVTTNKLEDGHAWRKYGQKRIQDSENPRSYYRCTHMPDQGCKARKQVQVSDTNPSEYVVSYFGQHTCRDPSTVPLLIEAAIDAPANFICFGGTAAASSSSHAVVPHRQAVDPMVLSRIIAAGCYSSSLPAEQERCGSEEVMGSSIKGKTTVGSAPDSWPSSTEGAGGGIDTGSFPSSPSSLSGFITGSFTGSGMDDDFMFSFDP